MKVVLYVAALFGIANLDAGAEGVRAAGDKTITKVVKLLQGMLEESKAASDKDAELYAKYKCYCDQNTDEKTTTIDSKTKEIALLTSSIEQLQADNSKLSEESAKLVADIAAAQKSKDDAIALRTTEKQAFEKEEADLVSALEAMDEAIKVLQAIGADQTLGKAAADNEKFLAGYTPSLITKLKPQVKKALTAAVALIPHEKRHRVLEFIQAPFTGTYTTQSVEVIGILKEMHDTFSANLAQARDTEAKAVAAHDALVKNLDESIDAMTTLNNAKQTTLSDNDDILANRKVALTAAITEKDEAEDFLGKLTSMCDEKAKEYNERKLMRANEDAALAQAIAILNSDQAFELFGKVSATSTGATSAASFLQLRRVSQHDATAATLIQRLTFAVRSGRSLKLAKVLDLLQKGNPFDTVLVEIEKMMKLIDEEGASDKENLDFCNKERTEKDAFISQKEGDIDQLKVKKTELENNIKDPASGLKKQIEENDLALIQNREAKETQTKVRKEANLAYQEDIKNLVEAEDVLAKAIAVLKKYYDELAAKLAQEGGFMQKDEPAPPATWEAEKGYRGQSVKGTDAVTMLQFILDETKKEEADAHTSEQTSQHTYEDDMAQLVSTENGLLENKVNLAKALADAESELALTIENLQKTEDDKKKLEDYLLSIKPGCDFITANFATRESHRGEEKSALTTAVSTIKDSPAYKAAVAAAAQAALGTCQDTCNAEGLEHVTCKACLAGVTVPGYCAGHPGTLGC